MLPMYKYSWAAMAKGSPAHHIDEFMHRCEHFRIVRLCRWCSEKVSVSHRMYAASYTRIYNSHVSSTAMAMTTMNSGECLKCDKSSIPRIHKCAWNQHNSFNWFLFTDFFLFFFHFFTARTDDVVFVWLLVEYHAARSVCLCFVGD